MTASTDAIVFYSVIIITCLTIIGSISLGMICLVTPIFNVFKTPGFTNFDPNSPAKFNTRISAFQLLQSSSSSSSKDAAAPFYEIRNTFDESKPNFPSYLKWDSESTFAINEADLATFSTNNFFNVSSAARNSTFSWVCIKSLNSLSYILQLRRSGLIVRLVGEFFAAAFFLVIQIGIREVSRGKHGHVSNRADHMCFNCILFFAGLLTFIGAIIEFASTGLLSKFISTNYCVANPNYPASSSLASVPVTAAMEATDGGEFWKANPAFVGAGVLGLFTGLFCMFASCVISFFSLNFFGR